jgi:hypothetical protein
MVATILMATFLSMLVVCAIAIARQRPPTQRLAVFCPEDGALTTVEVDRDPGRNSVYIAACDHRCEIGAGARCHEGCLPAAIAQFGKARPSTVLP